MRGVELEVVWDGRHQGADRDLFSPVEFVDPSDPPDPRLFDQRDITGPLLAALDDTWQTLAALAQKARRSRQDARGALFRLWVAGKVSRCAVAPQTPGGHRWVYRRPRT